MSLVGTRPPTEDEWKQYKPYHRARLSLLLPAGIQVKHLLDTRMKRNC